MPEPVAAAIRVRNLLLLLLAGTAGAVDALSYVGLGRVFTANMTGNTVLLGLAVGQAEGLAVVRSSLAMVGFVGGVALGAGMAVRGGRGQLWPRGATAALAVEWALLCAFAGLWLAGGVAEPRAGTAAALIVLSALAMGIQSAVARRLDVSGVATTYITGTLTTLASSVVDRARAAAAPAGAAPSAPLAWSGEALLGSTWLVYVAGAALVAAASALGPAVMLAVPVALMTTIVLTALLRLRSG